MPAYPYRRRRRFRRRAAYFRYGGALRRRYRRWRRRWFRPRYRRVRRRRGRRRTRGWRRRWYLRRYKKRRPRRYPMRLIQWAPRYRVTCYITGYGPVMWFTRREMYRPFLDPLSGMFLGGGISVYYWTLDMLYSEMTQGRNRWSKSNFGFPYARFRWAKFWFRRDDSWSYIISWAQGEQADASLPWSDIHPSVTLLNKRRAIVRCNAMLNERARYKTKKLFFRPPVDMTNQWYKTSTLAHSTLVRLCCTLADFDHPWFWIDSWETSKGYYSSFGYKTPDLRSLCEEFGRNGSTQTRPMGDMTTTTNAALTAYRYYWPWGGIYNGYKDPRVKVVQGEGCDSVMGETWTGVKIILDEQRKYGEESSESLAQLAREARNHVGSLFQVFSTTNQSLIHTNTVNRQKHAGSACLMSFPRRGLASEYSMRYTGTQDFADHTFFKQCFWMGRYNAHWDNGHGNQVWGYWQPSSGWNAQWDRFARRLCGPPPGLYDTVRRELVDENTPYYQVFYGHTYNTYLTWLNLKFPKIVEKSLNKQGFFAVGIGLYPAYPVMAGAFPEGYAPMVYQGDNYQYFSRDYAESHKDHTWTKWWPPGQSHPPLNAQAEIDFNCRVHTILCDGRSVVYGQRLEGTQYYIDDEKERQRPGSGRLWGNLATSSTGDDIAAIGKTGPFVPKMWLNADQENDHCPNIYMKYRFKFQWGADKWPGRWTEMQRPSSFNDPGEHPLPPGFPEEDLYVPPGSPSKPSKSKKHVRDPNIYTGHVVRRRRRSLSEFCDDPPCHPHEASAQYYDPRRHLGADGLIKNSVFKRLTSSHTDYAGPPVPRRRKVGTPDDWQLWAAYKDPAANYEPSASESSFSTSTEGTGTSAETSSEEDVRRPRPAKARTPPYKKHRRRSERGAYTHKRGAHELQRIYAGVPTRSGRRHTLDLGILQRLQQLRDAFRLRRMKTGAEPSGSCTVSARSSLPLPHPTRI
ncbi:ORF1 [torque teno Delphinidae virus 53]